MNHQLLAHFPLPRLGLPPQLLLRFDPLAQIPDLDLEQIESQVQNPHHQLNVLQMLRHLRNLCRSKPARLLLCLAPPVQTLHQRSHCPRPLLPPLAPSQRVRSLMSTPTASASC